MYTADQVLQKADNLVPVLFARLDNTAVSEFGYEDFNCGFIGNCGFDPDLIINSNSAILITGGQAINSGGSDVIINGLRYGRQIGENFTSDARVPFSFGVVNLDYRTSLDRLHWRDWDSAKFQVKIGGTIDGVAMRYSEYPLLIDGRVSSHDFDEVSMSVGFNVMPRELNRQFPLNKIGSGSSRGKSKPYVIGHVRNMSPIDLGSGTYIYHDGSPEGVVKAYDNGVDLTYIEINDLKTNSDWGFEDMNCGFIENCGSDLEILVKQDSNEVQSGFWTEDFEGLIYVNPYDSIQLTAEVKGQKIDGVFSQKANVCLNEIVNITTSENVPFTYAFDGDNIGWVFYDQKRLRDHLVEFLAPLDCYFTQNQDDNGITVHRRYNGQYEDVDGNPNNREAFAIDGDTEVVLGSFRNNGSTYRPAIRRIHYSRNFGVLTGAGVPAGSIDLKKENFTETEFNRDVYGSPSEVFTALTDDVDAQRLGQQSIARDTRRNKFLTMSLDGIGRGLEVGTVGTISHELIPKGRLIELRKVMQDTQTRVTEIEAVMYG